jgi:hypothetical protein
MLLNSDCTPSTPPLEAAGPVVNRGTSNNNQHIPGLHPRIIAAQPTGSQRPSTNDRFNPSVGMNNGVGTCLRSQQWAMLLTRIFVAAANPSQCLPGETTPPEAEPSGRGNLTQARYGISPNIWCICLSSLRQASLWRPTPPPPGTTTRPGSLSLGTFATPHSPSPWNGAVSYRQTPQAVTDNRHPGP